MRVGAGTELDFLDLDDFLFLARFGFAFLGFVFELSEIHDLADRWKGLWGNLDEVFTSVHCNLEGIRSWHNPKVTAFTVEHSHFFGPYCIVCSFFQMIMSITLPLIGMHLGVSTAKAFYPI